LGSYFDGSQSGPRPGDPTMSGRGLGSAGGPPSGFMGLQTSSFTDFLASHSPGLLPGRTMPGGAGQVIPAQGQAVRDLPHATTIVAAVCDGGVVLAGDRRATAGSMIAKRDVEKVFRSDEFSGMGYAGTGSVGIEFVRLFQVELEHYEKMEGRSLSLEGKANRLAWMVRGNLAAAMQGLIVVPLFVGYDEDTSQGRIFSYDVAGGPYEEQRFYSIGSGSLFARGALKKLYADGMSVPDAVLACVQALYDAADDDSATGGPDLTRRIFPVIATITADGFRKLPEAESEQIAGQVVRGRMVLPDGPAAPLHNG
jgi:proteasome beta subunit